MANHSDHPAYLDEFTVLARNIQDVQLDILRKKHRKYGNKPILKCGHTGIIPKVDMKLERYRNLIDCAPGTGDQTTPEEQAEWEADVLEQLRDIANYCTLAEMLFQNQLLSIAKKYQVGACAPRNKANQK